MPRSPEQLAHRREAQGLCSIFWAQAQAILNRGGANVSPEIRGILLRELLNTAAPTGLLNLRYEGPRADQKHGHYVLCFHWSVRGQTEMPVPLAVVRAFRGREYLIDYAGEDSET
jgi:hypothetical protein